MTLDRDRTPEHRENLNELEPGLRNRVAALDEPVAWDDWLDVSRRSRTSMPRARRSAGFPAVVAASVAVLAVAGTLGVFLTQRSTGSSSHSFAATRPDFRQFALGSPPIAPNAVAAQTRLITSIQLRNGRHTLYVAPSNNRGVCYKWTGMPGGGCEQVTPGSLSVGWGKTQAVGVVSASGISSVRIEFTDGTAADPIISWIAAPINAGFFLYDIPTGKVVAKIDGYFFGQRASQISGFSSV